MVAKSLRKKQAPPPALHQVPPREQVGAQTGSLYEYQYHQAAAGTLSLIDNSNVVCVYCEWHDDFVAESADGNGFSFHQVKTRTASSGAWTLSRFFGLRGRGKNPDQPCDPTSPFAHLWDHTQKFGRLCGRFVFVTNGQIHPDLQDLLDASRSATSADDLAVGPRRHFDRVLAACAQAPIGATSESLLGFVARLTIRDGVGAADDLPSCRMLIAGRILETSEVDLLMSEARKIGDDLVAMVRERSHRVLNQLPATADELRAAKGIVLANLLSLLSLSAEGYRQLKVSGREAVVALSRLTRLCRRTRVPDTLIPKLCQFRTEYLAWWMEARHRVEDLEAVALRGACADLLSTHSSGGLKWEELIGQAKGIADKYGPGLNSSSPLTGELVLGLIVDLAVESET